MITSYWIKEGANLSEIEAKCGQGKIVEKIREQWYAESNLRLPFSFVGVIVQGDTLLKCYPKYWKHAPENGEKDDSSFRQVLRVMEKYRATRNTAFDEDVVMMFTSLQKKDNNRLAVLLGLLQDYHEHGLYTCSKDIIESNGPGEIHWDQTVNNTMAVLQDDCPYYVDLRTRRHIDDEYNYFRRLHGAVLTEASKELQRVGLLDLFGFTAAELSEEKTSDFGEPEYILYRLEQEESWQFNTRKQSVLRMMQAFLSEENILPDAECLTVFGTMKYHVVWENVCAEVLGNQLDTKLGDLGRYLRLSLEKSFVDDMKKSLKGSIKNTRLRDLIEKPVWTFGQKAFAADNADQQGRSDDEEYFARTLIPDVITFEQSKKADRKWRFLIFDAKYYMPEWGQGKITGQPGIGDITKQYLYQLAYNKFIEAHGMEARNCLLFPWAGNGHYWDRQRKGSVSLSMLTSLQTNPELQILQVRFISAEKFYELYLRGRRLDNIADTLELNELSG